jgi:hypothetical protein
MALITLPGVGHYAPRPPDEQVNPAFGTAAVLSATGDKVAFVGRFFHASRAARSITRFGLPFGPVVKAGGSALTGSLQDVATAVGPPGRPDEVQDQFAAIANADATFATGAWHRGGALSANRAVNFGDLLALVVEFDGAGRLGSDSVTLSTVNYNLNLHRPFVVRKSGGSWAYLAGGPPVVFECTDGTFGCLHGGFPCSAFNAHSFNQSTAGADEYALEFQTVYPCKVDGGWLAVLTPAAVSDFDVDLYDGTTLMASGSVGFDANTGATTGGARVGYFTFPGQVALDALHTYRLSYKPSSGNNVTIYSFDVADPLHFACHEGGPAFRLVTRLDNGAWGAPTLTRRPLIGLSLSALDDGETACDYPQAGDVQSGVVFGNGARTGTLVLPAPSHVLLGDGYGAAGTEFTGNLVAYVGGSTPAADHSPADVLRWLLINLGLCTAPLQNPPSGAGNTAWPAYAAEEPPRPDAVVTCYDTDGYKDGRSMTEGDRFERHGVQVRVRCADPKSGVAKARQIADALDRDVYQSYVTIDGVTYLVDAVTRASDVVSLGRDAPQGGRSVHTLNVTFTGQKVS